VRDPRLSNRDLLSSTRVDARNNNIHPDANDHDAGDNRMFLVLDCTKFQHALAFEMRAAVAAVVASC